MRVEDVMTADPVTVTPGTSLKQVLRTMAGARVTAVPVVDDAGVLLGIVSEADAVAGALAPEPRTQLVHPVLARDPGDRARAEGVMTADVVTAHPDDDLADALDALVRHRHKSLPVVDRSRHVVGMVSRSDVVRLLTRDDADLAAAVRRILARTVGGEWEVEVREGVVSLTAPAAALHDVVAAGLLAETVPGVLGVRDTPREGTHGAG